MLALHVRHLLIAATLPLGACVDNTLYPAPLPAYQPQAPAPIAASRTWRPPWISPQR